MRKNAIKHASILLPIMIWGTASHAAQCHSGDKVVQPSKSATRAQVIDELHRRGLSEYFTDSFTKLLTGGNKEKAHISIYPPETLRSYIVCKNASLSHEHICVESSGGNVDYFRVCIKELSENPPSAPPEEEPTPSPPPPSTPPMCEVKVPPALDCEKVTSNFADFSNSCSYAPARTEYQPC